MTATIRTIDFGRCDTEIATRIAQIRPTVEYGLRKFPTPKQYHDTVAALEPSDREQAYALAQRDWHVRGQTGCMFARLAALQAETLAWEYSLVDAAEPGFGQPVEAHLAGLHARSSVEVVSLLFPRVTTPQQAVSVIRGLVAITRFWLERDEVHNDIHHLNLRCPVGTPGATVDAWVMGFAPFTFMPNTRRSPYFELAIRVKEKPEWIFHRLTQDRHVAHLADVPLEMSDKYWEDRWQSTLARTRMILGGEPDATSAAKSTFTVPLSEFGEPDGRG